MKLFIPKERNRYLFYILFSINVILLFLNYSFKISIPSAVFIAVLVLAALIGDKDEIISVCICCIAWCEAIKWYYVVIICIVIFLFRCRHENKFKIDFGVIPLILIVIWEYLHCFSGKVTLKSMLAFSFLYLFFIMLFFARDMQTIDYNFVMRNFAYAVLVVCCILIMRLLIADNFNFASFFLDMQRLGQTDEESGGMVVNPNSLGTLCVLAIGCLIQIRSAGQQKKFDTILLVAILALGALTCSRTYLACLLILCVFLFVISDGGIKVKLRFLLGSIIVLLVAILFLTLVFPEALKAFALRFSEGDIMSGRDVLFAAYQDYLFSSAKAIIWGLGSLNLGEKVMQLGISFNVPHNGIQEILVAWGVMGIVLFAALIFILIRRSKQENPHQSWINYALLVVLSAKIMVGQVITSNYTMLSFALIYLSMCYDCSKKTDSTKQFINQDEKALDYNKNLRSRKDECYD